MLRFRVPIWLSACAIVLTAVAFAPSASFAVPDDTPPPKPKPKPKPASKDKDKDKNKGKDKTGSLSDDHVYSLGYWQAKDGEYAAALDTLRSARNQNDPRIATMIGFSLRKLGRVEEAMGYYNSVLAAHPDRTTTRQYLGEAFLQIGAPHKAKEQLSEIAKRCGVGCEDYRLLAVEIAKFEGKAG
jgi:predicted Zn-dependent protease